MQDFNLLNADTLEPFEQVKVALLQNDTTLACKIIEEHRIKMLDLSGMGITNENIKVIIKVLSDSNTINELNLSHNKLTCKEIELLANFLKSDRKITSLDLNHNPLNSEGLKNIAGMLHENRTIKVLKISRVLQNNDINAVEALAEAIKNNQVLCSLIFNANATVPMLTTNYTYCASFFPTWINLPLSYGDQIVALLCEALQVNKTLKTLSLKDNSITDQGLKHFANLLTNNANVALTDLYIGNTESSVITMGTSANVFSINGAAHIAHIIKNNKTLRRLNIAECDFGLGEGKKLIIEALQQNQTLTSIDFSSTYLIYDTIRGTVSLLLQVLKDNWNLLDVRPSSKEIEKLLCRNRENAEALAKKVIESQHNHNLNEEDINLLNQCKSSIKAVLKIKFKKSEEEINQLLSCLLTHLDDDVTDNLNHGYKAYYYQ